MSEEQLALEYPDEIGSGERKVMQELCDRIDRFNDYWPKLVVEAKVYKIEFYENGRAPTFIQPETIEGQEAVELCAKAYRSFSRQAGLQHPSSVYRLPGYVLLSKLVNKEVKQINETKARLQSMIKENYPKYAARNQFCAAAFQGRMMLQVYRRIHAADKRLEAVRFTWSPKSRYKKIITTSQALQMIDSQIKIDGFKPDYYRSLELDRKKILALDPEYQIYLEKSNAPHPLASLVYKLGKSGEKRMVPMSLPVIIGPRAKTEATVDYIGELEGYDESKRKKTRDTRLKANPLTNTLGLYYQKPNPRE